LNESTLLALLAGCFGLLIGSFLNVCISRLPYDESVVSPRSHCPHCATMIAWYDNVPVVSYLVLMARCRHCRAPISARYPIVELLTGALFAAIVWRLGLGWPSLKWCAFAAIVVELAFSDLETRILPDEFTKGGALLGIVLAAIVPLPPGLFSFAAELLRPNSSEAFASLVNALLSAGFLSGGLYAMGALYQRLRGREGMGLGDVKMVAMLGAFLGLETALLGLMIGSLLGSVIGLTWIKLRSASAADYELPFGSFLALGALLAAVTHFR
jgi:leader peptidase (prepilin peptidase)/N-methyltransferase